MEILAWFGRLDPGAKSFVPFGDLDKMAEALMKSASAGCGAAKPYDLRALAREWGFVKDDAEYNRLLRNAAINLARRELNARATAEQDLLQATEALDDLNQAVNLLDERLYEWSRLHKDEIVHGKDLAAALRDDKIMGEMARAILNLRESRRCLEAEVMSETADMAPNLSGLAGPVLAARLISRAGGLKRLAEMPSSAVQVMGAEKSLFKHLNGNAPSPKHGLIYRHPAISGAPKKLRGKAARALAGKLAIAARLDYYGSCISPDLKAALDKRLAEIRQKGSAKPSKRAKG